MKKITTIGMALLLGGIGFAANAQLQVLKPVAVYYDGGNKLPDQLNIEDESETIDGVTTYAYKAQTNGVVNVIPETIYINYLNASSAQVKPSSSQIAVTQWLNETGTSTQPLKYEVVGSDGKVDYVPAYVYLDSTEDGLVTVDLSELSQYSLENQSGWTFEFTIKQGAVTLSNSALNENAATTIVVEFVNKYITSFPEPQMWFVYPFEANSIGFAYDESVTLVAASENGTMTGTITPAGGPAITGVPLQIKNWGAPNNLKNYVNVNLNNVYVLNGKIVAAGTKDAKSIYATYGNVVYTLSIAEGTVKATAPGEQNQKVNNPLTADFDLREVVADNIFPDQNIGVTKYDYNNLYNQPIVLAYEFPGKVTINNVMKGGVSQTVFDIYTYEYNDNDEIVKNWVNGLYFNNDAIEVIGNYVVVTLSYEQLDNTTGDFVVEWKEGALTVDTTMPSSATNVKYNNAYFNAVEPYYFECKFASDYRDYTAGYFDVNYSGEDKNLAVDPDPELNVYNIYDINNVSCEWLNDQIVFTVNSQYTLRTPDKNYVYRDYMQNTQYGKLGLTKSNSEEPLLNEDGDQVMVADFGYTFDIYSILWGNNEPGDYQILIPQGSFINATTGEPNKGIVITYTVPELEYSTSITPDPYYTTGNNGTSNHTIYNAAEDLTKVVVAFAAPIAYGQQPALDEDGNPQTITVNGFAPRVKYYEIEGNSLVFDLSGLSMGLNTVVIPTGFLKIGESNYNKEISFTYAVNNLNPKTEVNFYEGEIVPVASVNEDGMINLMIGWQTDDSIQLANEDGVNIYVNGNPVLVTYDMMTGNIPGFNTPEEGGDEPAPLADEDGDDDGDEEAPFYSTIIVENILKGYSGAVTIEIPAGIIYTGEAPYLVVNEAASVTVNVVDIYDLDPYFEISGLTIQSYWGVPVLAVNETVTPYIEGADDFVYELTPGYIDVVENLAEGYISSVNFNLLGARLQPGQYTLVIPEAFVTIRQYGSNVDSINLTVYYDFTLTEDYEIEDGHTSAIESIGSENVVEGVYNLQGVKMSNDLKSLTPGLYIINGKKVLIRK